MKLKKNKKIKSFIKKKEIEKVKVRILGLSFIQLNRIK